MEHEWNTRAEPWTHIGVSAVAAELTARRRHVMCVATHGPILARQFR